MQLFYSKHHLYFNFLLRCIPFFRYEHILLLLQLHICYGLMDWRTDGLTDRRSDDPTDQPTYRLMDRPTEIVDFWGSVDLKNQLKLSKIIIISLLLSMFVSNLNDMPFIKYFLPFSTVFYLLFLHLFKLLRTRPRLFAPVSGWVTNSCPGRQFWWKFYKKKFALFVEPIDKYPPPVLDPFSPILQPPS